MPKLTDLLGRQYGQLTVQSRAANIDGRGAWTCACDCGGTIVVRAQSLQAGATTTCGGHRVAMPAAERIKRAAEANLRFRKRHPDRVSAAQKACDANPERKAKKRDGAARKRKTPAGAAYRKEYMSRPHVKIKTSERNKTQASKDNQSRYWAKPESKLKRAALMRRVRSTPHGALNNRMSVAIHRGLDSGKQGKTWRDCVGYTVDQLRRHIERQFLNGMSWSNAPMWHIDHITPLSSFQFSSPEDDGFRAAWAITNLRPLWKERNLAKGAKREVLL